MNFYVAIDGADGCGKTTQATLLAAAFASRGTACLHLREPGSTPLGEGLRRVLLDPSTGELDPLAEALAFSAARREMLVREVAPALAGGVAVVAERCFLSTVAYQCRSSHAGQRADEDLVRDVTAHLLRIANPDLIIVLDVPEAVAASRLVQAGRLDRIEARPPAFHAAVRAAMRSFAAPDSRWAGLLRRPGDPGPCSRIRMLDGTASREQVHARILALVGEFAR
ncbi:MAG: dTMP kinase [Planctomycetota bacterium]